MAPHGDGAQELVLISPGFYWELLTRVNPLQGISALCVSLLYLVSLPAEQGCPFEGVWSQSLCGEQRSSGLPQAQD